MLSRSYASRKICPKITPLRPLDYARVSTYGHSLDAQLEQLREAGCTKICRENVTACGPTVFSRMRTASDADAGENSATRLYSDARKRGFDKRINPSGPWWWAPRPAGSDPDGQAGTRCSITGSLGLGTEACDGNLPSLSIVRGALAGQARQSVLQAGRAEAAAASETGD